MYQSKPHISYYIDLVSEYQQYQEATADDDEDEDGYDDRYDDEVQEDDQKIQEYSFESITLN